MSDPALRRRAALAASVTAAAFLCGPACKGRAGRPDDGWEILALSYGASPGMARKHLIAGGGAERTPMAWYVWLLRRGDDVVLVDTGFDDAERAGAWQISGFRTATAALAAVGVAPADVDLVVLTHPHWDHAGGLSQFPRAQVHVRKADLDWFERRVAEGQADRSGLAAGDLAAIHAARHGGRLVLDGEGDVTLLPGVTLAPGGGHTPGAQWLIVRAYGGATVVLASDNSYLYDNAATGTPIGSAASRKANVEALRRMTRTASSPDLVIPGHDVRVLDRFPTVAPGVVRIAGPPGRPSLGAP